MLGIAHLPLRSTPDVSGCRVLAVVEAIYDAIGEPDGWQNALARVGQALAADLVAIGQTPPVANRSCSLVAIDGRRLAYREPYRQHCERLIQQVPHDASMGSVVVLSPAGEAPAHGGGVDGNAAFPPIAALGAVIRRDAARTIAAVIGRLPDRCSFSRSDANRFAFVVRHLGRAMRLTAEPQARPADRIGDHPAFMDLPQPLFLVDADLRVIDVNRQARHLLDTGVLRISRSGALTGSGRDTGDDLARCVAGVLKHGNSRCHCLIHRRDGHPLTARVLPTRQASLRHHATALVMVFDPDHHPDTDTALLEASYSLTQAEARVVRELIYAPTLPDTAARLNMSYATARTHLAHVFQKTQVSSQAELVSLVLRGGLG